MEFKAYEKNEMPKWDSNPQLLDERQKRYNSTTEVRNIKQILLIHR